MADIFVSYAHVDDVQVRAIVSELEKLNLTVWWDIALRSGESYAQVIENELAQAKCVLAVWSRQSRNSDWVRAEASLGNDAKKLVQIVLQKDVRPPLPFNIIHYEPLARGPSGSDENWGQLVEAIRQRVGGAASERAPARAPNPINAASVLSMLSAAGLIAYLSGVNSQAVAAVFSAAPMGLGILLPLYSAAVFGVASALLTAQRIAAVASAGR